MLVLNSVLLIGKLITYIRKLLRGDHKPNYHLIYAVNLGNYHF